MNERFCRLCGGRLASGDRFCGDCGASVPPPEKDKVSDQPTTSNASATGTQHRGDRERGSGRNVLIVVALVVLLGVGIALALATTRSSAATIEPVAGMAMEIPDGWTAPANQRVTESNPIVELVPEKYGDVDVEIVGSEDVPATILIGEGSESNCDVEDDVIRIPPLADQEMLDAYGMSESFVDTVTISRRLGAGRMTVEEKAARWALDGTHFAMPWGPIDGIFAEYPNYTAGSMLIVCLPDENVTVSLITDASLYPSDPVVAAANGLDGPDGANSAYDASSIEETNRKVQSLYAEHVPALMTLVESVDTGGLFPRETNLSGLPLRLSGDYALDADPFAGELTEPETDGGDGPGYFDSEPDETAEPPEGTTILEEVPEDPPAYVNEQAFFDDYYAAVAREDWAYTYSKLSSDAQAEFTESEWIAVQEARVASTGAVAPVDVTVLDRRGEGGAILTELRLVYADGSEEETSILLVTGVSGEYDRDLSDDDIAYLRGFL